MSGDDGNQDEGRRSADRILACAAGAWMCGVAAAAVRIRLFELTEIDGGVDAQGVAEVRAIAPRAAQAMLDGLLGLGLVTRAAARYHNAPEASFYLVPGRPDYLGDFVLAGASDMPSWTKLAEVVASGQPLVDEATSRIGWPKMVRSIAPLALAAARTAAERLAIESAGAFRMLDAGGGAGAFSAVWLALNEQAYALQIDSAAVNAVAHDYVAGFGVCDRFELRDGDVRELEVGGGYRFAVLSQLVHFFTADDNRRLFTKLRAAIEPGGVPVIADFVLDDERRGDPLALLFGANMLLGSEHGRALVRGEVEAWLGEAGFDEIATEPIAGMPHSLLYAR